MHAFERNEIMTAKNIGRKALAAISAAAIAFGAVFAGDTSMIVSAAMDTSEFSSGYTYPTQMRGLSAFALVSDMGPGWNLGNSLESEYDETYWGNPKTTKAMIDAIAAKGFTTLRVPVRWDDHFSSGTTIDTTFMDRVETVVNYGLANDMYVILNVHHNDSQQQVSTNDATQTAVKNELSSIWTQIGNRFKNYGDKLIFETINEPRCGDDWTGNASYYQCVNDYNETARAAIRSTGGNNAKRLIMMPTYCASGDEAKAAAWTKNSNDSMIAASIHAYLPFDFAFQKDGHSTWLESDYTELEALFTRLNKHFISKGVPVVIGEFGAQNKSNLDQREIYCDIYPSLARRFAEQDIPCVWWDNNCFYTNGENFGMFNRNSCSFDFGTLADALIAAYEGHPEYEIQAKGETVLFEGSSSCQNYGQAFSYDASAVTNLSAGDKIYCNYSSSSAPEFILQSFTDNSRGWVKVAPDSASNGVAVWSYESLAKAYGTSMSSVGKVYIGDTGSYLTITKVYIPGASAHTHSYNGASSISLPATATTCGRKKVCCSTSGCDAYRVLILPPVTTVALPSITAVTAGDSQVSLSWSAVSGASKYAVYTYLNGNYNCVGSTTATSYTVKNLTNGTEYGFLVRADVDGTWSDFDVSDLVYSTPKAEAKPKITAAVPGENRVALNWTSVNGASKYAVYSYFNNKFTCVGSRAAGVTGMYVTGLTNGSKYGFLVRAYVNGKWTSYTSSDIVYATPISIAKPKITKAIPANGKVALNWTSVNGASKYAVYTYYNGQFACVGSRAAGVTGMYVTGLTNGSKYGFLVRAYVNGAWTTYSSSDIVYATPQA